MKEVSGIGIIGGGQMAEALIKGFLEKKLFSPKKILVSEPLKERREYLTNSYKIKTTPSNIEVVREKEIILLAVKPQVMAKVLEEIKTRSLLKSILLLLLLQGSLFLFMKTSCLKKPS